MRKKVKEVAYYAAPRMLLYHPIMTFRNLHHLKKTHRHL
jgi:hypothetical protein